MNTCRNCNSVEVKDLGFIGEVAPFFLKRIFNLEVRAVPSAHPLKRLIQTAAATLKPLLRSIRQAPMMEMQVCTRCSFVQTKHPLPDESLNNLYRDYRSASYNRERIHYEPAYGRLAGQVGSSAKEVRARIDTLTDWIQGKLMLHEDFSMLDYGGADGRFLPQIPGKKFVYEISGVEPVEGVIPLTKETELGTYSYVQLAHILEHVSWPLAMVQKMYTLLSPGGYIYIEVPQDASDAKVSQLVDGTYHGSLLVHEHINTYTAQSISHLLRAAGMKVLHVEAVNLDLGWTKTVNIRALGRKP